MGPFLFNTGYPVWNKIRNCRFLGTAEIRSMVLCPKPKKLPIHWEYPNFSQNTDINIGPFHVKQNQILIIAKTSKSYDIWVYRKPSLKESAGGLAHLAAFLSWYYIISIRLVKSEALRWRAFIWEKKQNVDQGMFPGPVPPFWKFGGRPGLNRVKWLKEWRRWK